MTEEELAAYEWLMAQAESNPLAFTANEWGQGPGFLDLPKEPNSWKRMGDKNDLLGDLLRTTDIDFGEMVPGLYEQVLPPDPEDLQYEVDPIVALYANDPAMQFITNLIDDPENPVSPTQALNALKADFAENPDKYAGYIPTTTRTQGRRTTSAPDWESFGELADTYLAERGRATDAERQAAELQARYDDFVRGRTEWDKYVEARPDEEQRKQDYLAQARELGANFGGPVAPTSDGVDVVTERTREAPRPKAGALQQGYGVYSKSGDTRNLTTRQTRRVGDNAVARNEARNMAADKAAFAQFIDDKMKRIQSARPVASKKEENLARIIAAYNTYQYGQ